MIQIAVAYVFSTFLSVGNALFVHCSTKSTDSTSTTKENYKTTTKSASSDSKTTKTASDESDKSKSSGSVTDSTSTVKTTKRPQESGSEETKSTTEDSSSEQSTKNTKTDKTTKSWSSSTGFADVEVSLPGNLDDADAGTENDSVISEQNGCSYHAFASCHEEATCIDVDLETNIWQCVCPEGLEGDGLKGENNTGCGRKLLKK